MPGKAKQEQRTFIPLRARVVPLPGERLTRLDCADRGVLLGAVLPLRAGAGARLLGRAAAAAGGPGQRPEAHQGGGVARR